MVSKADLPPDNGLILIEVDTSSKFDQVLHDFAVEQVAKGVVVYLFSARGSLVRRALTGVEGARFYTFSSAVTFPKPGDRPIEILIPSGDQAVLLDCFSKMVTLSSNQKVAVVLDNLSDIIVSYGLEEGYKLLKGISEVMAAAEVSAMFIMIDGAHDERTLSLVRGFFPSILHYDRQGLSSLRY